MGEVPPVGARVLRNTQAQTALMTLGPCSSTSASLAASTSRRVDATYDGTWELPVLGEVAAPSAVLVRPDGHVAWMGRSRTGSCRRR